MNRDKLEKLKQEITSPMNRGHKLRRAEVKRLLEHPRDVAVYLTRVQGGWILQDSLREFVASSGYVTKGKYRDFLTPEGRTFLAKYGRRTGLDDILDAPQDYPEDPGERQ